MSEQTSFEALRARKRADHLIDLRDEIASALTHGLGAVAALAGGAVLITLAAIYGDGWQLGASIVFGVTLLLLYTASTLYHAIQHPVAKGRLKVFDHCAIYLLIAGTYTPFTLIGLRGPWGWGLFTAIWTLAIAGTLMETTAVPLAMFPRSFRVSSSHTGKEFSPVTARVNPARLDSTRGFFAMFFKVPFTVFQEMPPDRAKGRVAMISRASLKRLKVR